MWHVKDVGDVILIFFECIAIYVEDIEDRSNTPKGCNAMYVEDVENGKRTYTHIFAHNFLNIQPIFNPQNVLESWELELFTYHQILRILKHVKDRLNTHKGSNDMYVKDGKRTYTHIFAHNCPNIQPIFNRQKFWEVETIPSNTVYIKACWRCWRWIKYTLGL